MRKILIVAIILGLALMNIKAFAASPPPVVADGALLIDTTTGEILYEKNKDTKFYPASTTKMMTALLVLENLKLDEKIVVGKTPPFTEGSKIYVNEGEEFTVEQMLYALIIASANDVASAFAERISGSEEAFGKLMTERAKQLGCTNTNFKNPHGLDDPEHYTTAYDLSLISREVMKYDVFRKIISTDLYIIEPTNKQPEKRYLHSNNNLMFNTKFKLEGANGAKTGYTTIAGHSIVATAERGDTKLMIVLLHDKKPGLWEDAYAILNYGFDTYKTTKEVSAGDVVTSIKLPDSDVKVPLAAEKDLYYTHPIDEVPFLNTSIDIMDISDGFISRGQKMGTAEYDDNGKKIDTVDLIATQDLPATALYSYKNVDDNTVKRVYKPWLLVPAAGFLGIAAVTGFKVSRKKGNKNRDA